MCYVITEPCIGKKERACCEVCPTDAFFDNPDKSLNDKTGHAPAKEGDFGMLFINPNICIHCGACESECPVEAIYEDSNVPEKWSGYVELAAKTANDTPPEELEKRHVTK